MRSRERSPHDLVPSVQSGFQCGVDLPRFSPGIYEVSPFLPPEMAQNYSCCFAVASPHHAPTHHLRRRHPRKGVTDTTPCWCWPQGGSCAWRDCSAGARGLPSMRDDDPLSHSLWQVFLGGLSVLCGLRPFLPLANLTENGSQSHPQQLVTSRMGFQLLLWCLCPSVVSEAYLSWGRRSFVSNMSLFFCSSQ